MRTFVNGLALVLCLAVGHAALGGIIAYDNFGPGDVYGNVGILCGQQHTYNYYNESASDFYPTASGQMDEFWGAITWWWHGTRDITLIICADGGSKPGTVLWSQAFPGVVPDAPGSFVHVSITDGPDLVAGTRYWVVGQAPEDGDTAHSWWRSNQGDLGSTATSRDHAPWVTTNNVARLAMRVGVVPEPSTFGLLAGAALALFRRR